MSTALVDSSLMPDWMRVYLTITDKLRRERDAQHDTGCPPGHLMSNCTTGFDWSTNATSNGVIALIGVLPWEQPFTCSKIVS